MMFKYPLKALLTTVVFIILFDVNLSFAQAPNISYPTPQHYTVGTTLTPLSPDNKGGNVPANTYGLVSAFAGNGKNGSANGQGPGENFKLPVGITTDKTGNFYVADGGNSSILKIDPAGTVTTLTLHFASPPTQFDPYGIAADANGNLYSADPFSNLVWKIDPSGNVTVFAGGTQGATDGQGTAASFNHPAGMTVDNAGNVYVADTDNQSIRKITSTGTVTTITTGLNYPVGLAINTQGTLFVVNGGDNQIKTVSPSGLVSTLAAGTQAGFNGAQFIAMDQQGNLYITDSNNNQIKKVTPAGTVTVIAGKPAAGSNGGIGAAAGFNNPLGITINAAGDLYVVDSNNNLVRQILLSGYTIDKTLPPGLTFDPNTGTISGTPTSSYPSTDYTITAFNASGGSSTTINITVSNAAIVLGPPNISYTSPDSYSTNTAIAPLTPVNTGGVVSQETYGVTTFAGSTGTGGTFGVINSIRSDGAGNLYVTDASQRLMKITPGGLLTVIAGSANTAGFANGQGAAALFNGPGEMAIDGAGNIYIADENNNVIREVTPGGAVTTFAGTGTSGSVDGTLATATFDHPSGLVFDAAGNMYVSDFNSNIIRKITPGGLVSTFAGTANQSGKTNGTGAAARFWGPGYLAADASGNIYVSDFSNNMIRMITPAGAVSTLAGSGSIGISNGTGNAASFNGPQGIAIDANGNLYVADQNNYVTRKITPGGTVTTFAGTGSRGATNGYPLNSVEFAYPRDIVIDFNSGDLYLADGGQIRKINPSGYTIDKPLPAGLSFDSTTGTISGIPTSVSPPTNYTVTAYNAAGSSSYVINITITGSVVPPPLINYQTPQVYIINSAIAPLSPNNTGGPVPASIYGQINTFAGSGTPGKADGTGRAASFTNPAGIAFDGTGNLYVADGSGHLRKITPAGVVSTINNFNGVASDLAFDGLGNIYIADPGNNEIEMLSANGAVSVLAGNPSPGAANGTGAAAGFNAPAALVMDASGNILVADQLNNLIRKVTPAGVVTTFAGSGLRAEADGAGLAASFNNPSGIAIDASMPRPS